MKMHELLSRASISTRSHLGDCIGIIVHIYIANLIRIVDGRELVVQLIAGVKCGSLLYIRNNVTQRKYSILVHTKLHYV